MTMPSIEPALDQSSIDWLKLKSELDEILKEQASGKWDPPADPTWVAGRVKRTIEITSILRRTNTGPAKAKGTRGRKKAAPDLTQIKADLLS